MAWQIQNLLDHFHRVLSAPGLAAEPEVEGFLWCWGALRIRPRAPGAGCMPNPAWAHRNGRRAHAGSRPLIDSWNSYCDLLKHRLDDFPCLPGHDSEWLISNRVVLDFQG